MNRREGLLALSLLIAGSAGACTPTPAASTTPAPPPTPTPSPTPSAVVTRDFTQPGEARKVVEELIAAAGTIQAVKVELERSSASLSVVSGMQARTYAWRDGQIGRVDSDTQFVGQAIFDPRDFAFDNLASLFATAGTIAKSTSSQQLQIVEYSDRVVLMTVTTNPESATVFFRRNGTLISPVDLSTTAGLSEALTDAVGSKKSVLSLGVLANNGGVYVDTSGGQGVVVRTIRMPKLPVRTASRRETTDLLPYDPLTVKPAIIIDVLTKHLAGKGTSAAPWSLAVDRRGGTGEPQMHFTIGGTDVVTTVTGVDITPR